MEQRRIMMLESSQEFDQDEKRLASRIVRQIGQDEIIDLDWDELEELTSLQLEEIGELLQLMHDSGVLLVLDFENSEVG